jgi:two-component system, sensor histidine kinase and response regulator
MQLGKVIPVTTPESKCGIQLLEPALEAVLANLDGMVYRCQDDAEWTMEYVSDGCERLTGYQPQDLLFNNRISYEAITYLDDRKFVRDAIQAAVNAGRRYEVEYRIIDADGMLRWVQERGTAIRDERGSVTALQGLITDITRIKVSEMRARLAQRRYRSLFDNALEGIFRTTLEGHYLDANQSLATLYGYDSPHALIHDVRDIGRQLYVNPGRREEFLYQVLTHGKVTNFESQVCCRDGRIIWISENVRAISDEQGRVYCFEGTVQDITDQKQYQQSLIEASEAAFAANEAKSAFLANMSHEIRTPMNGVIGIIELLNSTKLDRDQREYLQAMRGSADALLTVINDILDFSKIESGKMEIESVAMDLIAVVEDSVATLGFQASAKDLELVVDIDDDMPERINCDPQRIRQCLLNLIGNAIKFTSQGEVMVRVARDGHAPEAAYLRFEVNDTGIGIAADKLAALFEPFVQADSSTTRHFGGTGLGLSIVRRLVHMMGGEVGVNSTPGVGSTFWFRLPLVVDPEQPLALPTKPDATGRLLVVDDNASCRNVTMRHLQARGYHVSSVANGAEALSAMVHAAAFGASYDAVLIDSNMPGFSGLQLVEAIKHDRRLSSVRLIMLTGIDEQTDAVKLADIGIAGRLSKPLRMRQLTTCVEQLLSRTAETWRMRDGAMATGVFPSISITNRRYTGRVLLVEDNRVNQMVGRNLLERHGCTVEVANNGEEGLALYEAKKFDLVLMDMQMPVMDGVTATRRIRDYEGWRPRTPIVALTANAMTNQAERCFAAGMDGFLTKPIDTQRLLEMLDKYLQCESAQALAVELLESDESRAQDEQSTEHAAALIDKPLMNWTRFNELILGDLDFARELVDVYVESSTAILDELQRAASSTSVTRFKGALHKLKGVSANICAERLHAMCAEVEDSLAHDADVSLQGQQVRIGEIAAATEQEMQSHWRRAQTVG